jgi:hypothetical protein
VGVVEGLGHEERGVGVDVDGALRGGGGASGWRVDIHDDSMSVGWKARRDDEDDMVVSSGKKPLVDTSSPTLEACVHSSHTEFSTTHEFVSLADDPEYSPLEFSSRSAIAAPTPSTCSCTLARLIKPCPIITCTTGSPRSVTTLEPIATNHLKLKSSDSVHSKESTSPLS